MTKLYKPLIYSVIVLCIACSSLSDNTIPNSFSCFVGTWQLENTNTFEIWQNQDNFLTGRVIKINNADTLIVEKLKIFRNEDAIYYEATVPTQNEGKAVRFKLSNQTDNSFQFENPEHDFPKKIMYNFLNKKELQAIISDENKQALFNYNKIE